jgi:hypothetical protein
VDLLQSKELLKISPYFAGPLKARCWDGAGTAAEPLLTLHPALKTGAERDPGAAR